VTKAAPADRTLLLKELRANKVSVLERGGESTPVFENRYAGDDLSSRTQLLRSLGTPFCREDVRGIRARAFHLGPLVRSDLPWEILEEVSTQAEVVSLDVQGMVRPARVGQVTEEDWHDKEGWLQAVHILKADDREARILSGERDLERAAAFLSSLGPREVVITLEHRGSLIFAQGTLHHIPSFPPRELADPTGCGDTYMAGYLGRRLAGARPDKAALFAACVSTLKLEGLGPFQGNERDVTDRLSCFSPAL
jgi:sugar/nucleoside kinase (ribokinase family)